MVRQTQPEQTSVAAEGEATGREGDDLEVEPVATLRGEASRIEELPPAARVERLRRLALQLRVDALEAELERTRRRRDDVITRYERVLADRDARADGDEPAVESADGRLSVLSRLTRR